MREEVLKILEQVIFETAERCSALQYRSKSDLAVNPHKIRQGYLNALSSLCRTYGSLLKDQQIEELVEDLQKLQQELGVDLK